MYVILCISADCTIDHYDFWVSLKNKNFKQIKTWRYKMGRALSAHETEEIANKFSSENLWKKESTWKT